MTGEGRFSKRAEGVHYDPPLRMHIRIDGGHLRGSRVHAVSSAVVKVPFCS
jgi:hypothetical protein